MAEETTASEVIESSPAGFSPITTQEELDRVIGNRLSRAEKKFKADNKDVFEKAKAYDEWQESNKTDLQKAKDKANELQAELDELKLRDQVEAWKRQASEETGVPVEVLRGQTEEEITLHAETLKPHFQQSQGFVGSDGFAATPSKTVSTASQFAEALDNIL